MRTVLAACACLATLGLCAYLAGSNAAPAVKLRVRIVDGGTGTPIGGMLRLRDRASGALVKVPGLLDRLRGCDPVDTCRGWYVVPVEGAETALPRGLFRLEALHGLDTVRVEQPLDLRTARPGELVLRLPVLFRPEEHGLVAGNTHLHLRNMTRAEADEYLRTIPAADGLKVMLISYLERHLDDRNYVTNLYPIGDLKELAGTGTVFASGEEHRHNFEAFGQGYGHVMLLGIKQLVKPVSLGPGIMQAGNDDRPLRSGLDETRGQGGTAVWCHNASGYESVPDMLTGRLDALNIFDGSRRDTYEQLYYRFLNIGLRVPLSTGTDWFLYDFNRVYAHLEGATSVDAWLSALKRGQTMVTNGPLLTLDVDGQSPGGVLKLDAPRKVRVRATAIGRLNFDRLELICNGKVVHAENAMPHERGFQATLQRTVELDGPSWLAVRIASLRRNEFDQQLFGHTTPVFVDLGGRRVFDLDAAHALLRLLEEAPAAIARQGRFTSPAARERVLDLYRQAAADLRARINRRGA